MRRYGLGLINISASPVTQAYAPNVVPVETAAPVAPLTPLAMRTAPIDDRPLAVDNVTGEVIDTSTGKVVTDIQRASTGELVHVLAPSLAPAPPGPIPIPWPLPSRFVENALLLQPEEQVHPFVGGLKKPVSRVQQAAPWGGEVPSLACPEGCWADWMTSSCVCPESPTPAPADQAPTVPMTAETPAPSGMPWWVWAVVAVVGYLGYKKMTSPKKNPVSAGFASKMQFILQLYGPKALHVFGATSKTPRSHLDIWDDIHVRHPGIEPWEVQTLLEDLAREGLVYEAGGGKFARW